MTSGFKIKNLSEQDISSFNKILEDFIPYAQKQLGYDKPVKVLFISDPENAVNPLGKTAHYAPTTHTVTIYVDGRHPKDMMRSVSHELVHHAQNCRGDFDNITSMEEGYAQVDEHLREMEREAYESGNLIFRDFEDALKTNPNKQTIYITLNGAANGEKKIPEAALPAGGAASYCREVGVTGVKESLNNMNKEEILKEIVSIDESGNRKVNRKMLTELVKKIFEGNMADPGFKGSPFYTPQYVSKCMDSGFVESKNPISLRMEHNGWSNFLNEGDTGSCDMKTGADGVKTMVERDLEEGITADGKEFNIGDMVQVTGGGASGATGEIIEFAEGKAVVRLESDADKRLFGQATDEIIVRGEHLALMGGMNEMYGEDDDYFDALEAEFPFLSKAVKAGEVPEEVAADIAKEYGGDEEPQEKPPLDENEDADKEQQIRDIVDQKQMGEIDGTKLDLTSASAIVKVLDAINDQNKERFLSMPVDKMAQIAFKMMKEEKEHAN